jgi:D-beta-D-heptose 7-phosphate kinase / D-beta-D-heptose 1-phosphate adenosyltransferase
MTNLLASVRGIHTKSILVIGDFMLDEIVSGDAERLSPDAPVPVLEVRSIQSRAGGAGNVARCIAALGGSVQCLGVVGKDQEGEMLLNLLHAEGILIPHMLRIEGRPTTVKRSIVGLAQHRHPQKMFRLDRESKEPLCESEYDTLVEALKMLLPTTDVVCIEDYGKGVLSKATCEQVIALCNNAGVEVLVDPANLNDYARYKRATAITPNRSEAEKATGVRIDEDDPIGGATSLAITLCESLQVQAAILTVDKHGAILQERGADPVHVPTRARSVYDVTGAGDMVLAGIAVGRGSGLSWTQCVELANVAAGLEVEVFGATPIPMAQVLQEILRMQSEQLGKIRSSEQLAIEVAAAKEAGKRIVLTNGCFDVIHAGHVSYLREASTLGDFLIVGVNSDSQVEAQKGEGRPIYRLEERMEILAELQCVDIVTSFGEPTAETLIRAVTPDLYVKGGDYVLEEINEHGLLEELNIALQVLSERPERSSSDVVAQMRESS